MADTSTPNGKGQKHTHTFDIPAEYATVDDVAAAIEVHNLAVQVSISAAMKAHLAAFHADAEPTPEPPEGRVVEFTGTAAQFVTLAKDESVGTIVMGDTYTRWACIYDVLRTKPLLCRMDDAIFDGTGLSNAPAFRMGWSSPAGSVSFVGRFISQGYRLGKAGVWMLRTVDGITIDGLTVRDSYGDKSIDPTLGPQHAHAVYVGTNGPASPRSRNVTVRRLIVEGVPSGHPAYRMLNGVQTDGSPVVDGLYVQGSFYRLHRAFYPYNASTGLLIEDSYIEDCSATVETHPSGQTAGLIRNSRAVRSGPFAPGQGKWVAGNLRGEGNVAS